MELAAASSTFCKNFGQCNIFNAYLKFFRDCASPVDKVLLE